jgi:hypothetical protein
MTDPDLSPAERRAIIAEIVVVIALGVLPHLAGVVATRIEPMASTHTRPLGHIIYAIFGALQVVLPLLWIMHRSGRSWSYFGIRRFKPALDLALAPLIALLLAAVNWSAAFALYMLAYAVPFTGQIITIIQSDAPAVARVMAAPSGAPGWLALAMYMMANGASEELVLRGYLLARIHEVTGRPCVSIVLVSAMAAAYHLYQGSHATLIIFIGQTALGAAYLKIRRVLPFAIGHGLYDLMLHLRSAAGA